MLNIIGALEAEVDPDRNNAYFFGYIGVASALIFASIFIFNYFISLEFNTNNIGVLN